MYCAIISPDFVPGSAIRNGGSECGSPLRPSIRRKMRRSENAASSCTAIASVSSGSDSGWPWKLPPLSTSPSSTNRSGLSVTAPNSGSTARSTYSSASPTAPSTCGMQRSV